MENLNCSCGYALDKKNLFCPACGKKVEEKLPPNICSNCKNELSENEKFCPTCGTKNEPQVKKADNNQAPQMIQEPPVPNVDSNSENEVKSTDDMLADLLPNEQDVGEPIAIIQNDFADTQPIENDINTYQMQSDSNVNEKAEEQDSSQSAKLDESNESLAQSENVVTTQDDSVFVQAEKMGGRGNGVLKAIISVVLSILIFVFILATQMVLIVRGTFNQENIKTSIEETNISEIKVPKSIIESTHLKDLELDNDKNVSEYIVSIMDPQIVDQYDITESKIEKLLDESFIKNFLSDKITDYTDDVFKKTDMGQVTKKEIIKFIEDNSDKIEKTIDYRVSDEDIEKISTFFDENNVMEKISISYIREEQPKLMDAVKFSFSYLVVGLLIILTLLAAFAIFMVNKKKLDSVFYYLGSTAICSGSVVIILGILSYASSKIIKSVIGEFYAIVKPLTEIIFSQLILTGLITLGVGFVLIVTSVLISKFTKNKA